MKVLVVLLAILLIVLAVYLVRTLLKAPVRWRLEERSDGERLNVYAVKAGEQPLLVGAVPFAAEDFDYRIEEVRAQGAQRLIALQGPSGRR